MSVEVRRVETGDVVQLSQALARAFEDDPVSLYLFPEDSSRVRRLERYFRYHMRSLFIPRGEAWTTPDLEAASFWLPPGSRIPNAKQALWQVLPILAILGRRTGRAARLVQLLDSHHPRSAHFYLGGIGTDPPKQRHGYGSALLRIVHDRCDVAGLPCYLESSKEENLAFYHRHGYKVVGEVAIPDTPVRLWLMWREPGAGSAGLDPA